MSWAGRRQVAAALGSARAARLCAASALALFVLLLLVLVGRPLATDDLWFHLKMGEVYASEGLWPASDPMLYTAGDRRPVQHEWLFSVAVFGLERAVGFQGLRIAHVLAVAGILALVLSTFRRAAPALPAALAATVFFLVLSWWRLIQLRPDLVSIPAALALYRLLLAPPQGPGWQRVGLATLLLLVWANAHSLFGVGLALGIAGMLGIALGALLARRLPAEARPGSWSHPSPLRLGAALGLGGLVTLVNPRGFGQHLTFVSSSLGSAIWAVRDEWAHFAPFLPPAGTTAGLDTLSWLTTDALLLLLAGVAIWAGIAYLRRPSSERLRVLDPLHLGLALASAAAILVSIRFLWMACFILLFLLRAWRAARALHPCAPRLLAGLLAALSWGLLGAFGTLHVWKGVLGELAHEPAGYWRTPYLGYRYCGAGIRFLDDAGLEGNLFNPYHVGGYAGYWLAPRIRTFIDGRTEHYPRETLRDYLDIVRVATAEDRRRSLRLLDQRRVDLFLGVGVPAGYYAGLYTVELLANRPAWVLVFRALDHAIYLRRGPRNRENLQRVIRYYRARGIPFDARRGLQPAQAVHAAPDWAIAQGMVPPDFFESWRRRMAGDAEERFRALDEIGHTYWLLGAHAEQIDVDRAAARLQADAKAPRWRLTNTYLRQRRLAEAEATAGELVAIDPGDPQSQALYDYVARQLAPGR